MTDISSAMHRPTLALGVGLLCAVLAPRLDAALSAPPDGPAISQPGDDSDTSNAPARGPKIERQVRAFGFEERARQPYDFPVGWYRIGPAPAETNSDDLANETTRPGHPLFGAMRFSQHQPRTGAWCLEFELRGGSMTAAIAPRAVPIIPGGDYLVTAWVRTAGLTHAQARVSTRFLDQTGRTVPGTLAHSRLLQTRGEWTQVAVELPGSFTAAADVVVELELLQPAQYRSGRRAAHDPILEDVTGWAWFDDVVIWRLPRIELSTGTSGNIVIAPDEPHLRISLHDLASEPIDAAITVENLAGRILHRFDLPVERGRNGVAIPMGELRYGWYRATVQLRNGEQVLGRHTLDFAYLAEAPTPSLMNGDARFGVNLERIAHQHVAQSADVLRLLGVPIAVMPVWDHARGPMKVGDARVLFPELDRYLDADGRLILAIPDVPDDLVIDMRLDRHQVLDMFLRGEEQVRPYLQDLLVTFGERVHDWQVGTTRQTDAFWRDDLARAADEAWRAVARLVPRPRAVVPWSIEQPIADELADASGTDRYRFNMLVSPAIPAHALPAYLATLTTSEHAPAATLTLEPLAEHRFDRRHRAADLAFRALYAAREPDHTVLMLDPWHPSESTEAGYALAPDSALPAWITVSRLLHDKTFAGEVPIGRGMRCWLFEGRRESLLVAWNETASADNARIVAQLAAGDVTVTDLDGNERTVHQQSGQHEISLEQAPVYITGIDPLLAKFRQGFAVESSFAPSIPRQHEHEIVLRNPWDIAIAGSLRLVQPEDWSFSPARMTFAIGPGEEQRIPFTLRFGRTEPAGPKRLEAIFEFAADRALSLRMAADFEVGLDYIDIEPTWRLMRNADTGALDIVLSVYITNLGAQTLALEAFILAPNFQRMRRPVSSLEPGETVLKSFHLPDGAAMLSGETIRIGVAEIDNPERLNRSLEIPDLSATLLATEPDGR